MNPSPISPHLPKGLWALAALYCIASLIHFAHNAEYIAFYPNMPGWLTREQVYLVWLAISGFGVVGIALAAVGWRMAAAASLAAYGAFGLDGLGHYALALCSEHSLAMNLTIGFEAVTGVLLAIAACWCVARQARFRFWRVGA
ncbi:hypothetical protein AAFF27_08875 [Xylophilus sp. GW821-FHT01B05]